ncbi:Ig-like domain-containing protein [uncultured Photobacterium sp.]|uniref:Ig-like domain-containing protein n=1 Tax=uncultured Photobacterium sp. TaxID=173973 RepID=UPI0026296663|nr:Ig-like domain-containing protein [uncultured Photobacterium sp.]
MRLGSLLLLSLLYSSGAYADIIEYRFTDTQNLDKVASSTQPYINNSSDIEVLLSAGLDRKVRLTVTKDGHQVFTQASTMIGIDDRIADQAGKEYYAKLLTVPRQSDGSYTFRQEIIDSTGSVVGSQSKTVMVDTIPPSAGLLSSRYNGHYGMITSGSEWSLGSGGAERNEFIVSGIDDSSGIDSVYAVIYRGDGTEHTRKPADYDAQNHQGSRGWQSGLFPTSNLDELFELQFEIRDSAGNLTLTPRQKIRYDNYVGAPAVFGVYDPGSGNVLGPGLADFLPYRPGMTVKTNPVKLAWRLPKNNYRKYNFAGLTLVNGLGQITTAGEDSQYIYLTTTSPFGNNNGNYFRWSNQHQWGGAGISYNLVLAPNAPATPVLNGVDYLYSDLGWSSFYRYILQNDALPLTISKVRFNVEPRSYDQVATHSGGSCTIPAGQTRCEYNWSITLNKGETGYLHASATLRSSDGSLLASTRWAEVDYNDKYYPQVTTNYDNGTKILTAYIFQEGRGSYFDRLRLKDAWVIDADTGERLNVSGGLQANNHKDYTYSWDLTTLHEGDFNLAVRAQENHGPQTTTSSFRYLNDKTPPVIGMSVNGGPFTPGMLVKGLESILLSVTDDSEASITSINLSGGPASDDVELAWNNQGEQFGLEYPRIFPSQKGEGYTLTVTARDSFGQSTTARYTFDYEPNNLFTVDSVVTLPVSTLLRDHNNTPHTVIRSNNLRADDGSYATGDQRIFFTVRSDAAFGIAVAGVSIRQGETKEVIVNVDATQGKLELPVYPSEEGVIGEADFLMEIHSIN